MSGIRLYMSQHGQSCVGVQKGVCMWNTAVMELKYSLLTNGRQSEASMLSPSASHPHHIHLINLTSEYQAQKLMAQSD